MNCDERVSLLPATFIYLFEFIRIVLSSVRSEPDDLIARADIAMYPAKRQDRNRYCFYSGQIAILPGANPAYQHSL